MGGSFIEIVFKYEEYVGNVIQFAHLFEYGSLFSVNYLQKRWFLVFAKLLGSVYVFIS